MAFCVRVTLLFMGSQLARVSSQQVSHRARIMPVEKLSQFGCVEGVLRTKVGYTGGKKLNPTYTSLGDHTESVQIEFDSSRTTYSSLLDVFWANHDSTACTSRQYMSAIFYHDDEQRDLALASKETHQKKVNRKITTRIVEAETFYDAEDYHQKYLLRRAGDVLKELKLTDSELISSHVAARLNGYIGGYGTKENLAKEIDDFGLSESARKRVFSKAT